MLPNFSKIKIKIIFKSGEIYLHIRTHPGRAWKEDKTNSNKMRPSYATRGKHDDPHIRYLRGIIFSQPFFYIYV